MGISLFDDILWHILRKFFEFSQNNWFLIEKQLVHSFHLYLQERKSDTVYYCALVSNTIGSRKLVQFRKQAATSRKIIIHTLARTCVRRDGVGANMKIEGLFGQRKMCVKTKKAFTNKKKATIDVTVSIELVPRDKDRQRQRERQRKTIIFVSELRRGRDKGNGTHRGKGKNGGWNEKKN